MKASSIGWLLDNRSYKSNDQNYDIYDLPFDGYKRLIARRRLYCIGDNIVFS